MSQRSVCPQFTPQLWRAGKCKFCFNDKAAHEKGTHSDAETTPSPPLQLSPTPIPPTLMSPTRRNVTPPQKRFTTSMIKRDSDSETTRTPSLVTSDSDSNRSIRTPNRIKLTSYEDNDKRLSLTSPIENINLRLEMNKQLLAKDDKIHCLEIRNQNLENEIRSLKEQNSHLSLSKHSEEEEKKLLDKISTLKRKLSDLENKYTKTKDEKEDLEERLKSEEQLVSKLKIKINSMEHEQYMLELKVEREHKHKHSMQQEKEDLEIEMESLRKAYRNMQRESRKYSTSMIFDVDEERTRELEDQLRQTQRRLGMVEVENGRLKDKITQFENDKQDSQIQELRQQLSSAQDCFEGSKSEIEDLRTSHLAEIKSLQAEISRLQVVNEDLADCKTKADLEVDRIRRELQSADNRNSDSETKDEELRGLRAEVARLQDKCSALRDVELIHINLNRELDRQRERADGAEQKVRRLERQLEEEQREKEEISGLVKELQQKEMECRRSHPDSSPPLRSRSASLEPTLLVQHPGENKTCREPAERDTNSNQITRPYSKYKSRGLRKFQSLQDINRDQQPGDKCCHDNTVTDSDNPTTPPDNTLPTTSDQQQQQTSSECRATHSVEDLKNLFEGRNALLQRSVSVDARLLSNSDSDDY